MEEKRIPTPKDKLSKAWIAKCKRAAKMEIRTEAQLELAKKYNRARWQRIKSDPVLLAEHKRRRIEWQRNRPARYASDQMDYSGTDMLVYRDLHDCENYEACLNTAAKTNKKYVCPPNCKRYCERKTSAVSHIRSGGSLWDDMARCY